MTFRSTISSEGWRVRAAGCELLAFSLHFTQSDLAEVVASGEWADATEELATILGFKLPESFSIDARAAVRKGPEVLLHNLRAEYTRLFIGISDPVMSPFEGVWRAVDDGVQPLLFVNPRSMDVERFCKSCGLGRPTGTNEPLDHVATELELMQYLCMLEAGMVCLPEDGPSPDELPGGSPTAAFDQFMNEHVLVWMPRFASKLAIEAREPFFRAVASMLEAFLFTLQGAVDAE